MLSLFGLLALTIATIGVYGVTAYGVSQRVHEMGVRIALGAQRGDVYSLIVGRGLKLVITAVTGGLILSWASTRVLESLLFETSPTDLATYIVIPTALVAVATLASYVPVRRAVRADPTKALRDE